MKKRYMTRFTAAVLSLILILSFSGCGRVDNTIAEPDEITSEYLYGEYAEQLIRDGAEVTTGCVSVDTDENGTYSITVADMVVVESDITDAGYYVADANMSNTIPLDAEARITYIKESGSEPEVISVDELKNIVNDENFDPLKEGNEKLFDVYNISGSVVMVLAKELPLTE